MQTKKSSNLAIALIWFTAAISMAEILTGTWFAPLGWQQGLIAIVVGHFIGCLLYTSDVPFEWVELKNGGLGVFAISRKDLVKYHDSF